MIELFKGDPEVLLSHGPVPAGFEFIAAVTTDKWPLGANLIKEIRNKTYWLHLGGGMSSCNQQEARSIETAVRLKLV